MKILRSMKAALLSGALAIGVGTVGFAMFANAQSTPTQHPASQSSQKDTDKETNDDAQIDNQKDGETADDGTATTQSPSTN